ncbi:hypothetical protein KL930_004040 [Ogataea haglerorum]|uniref:BOD1/SHG1 domain-containing protein n=1 Tax=Ogataea haglerorum TaxID=1937702 RepID=A0AAN6I2P8_9ASCO|nr:uncharacterized protein KL911_001384 [Ogataea haglerorum]KAG7693356.1 hypothetical protein KL915_004255 [Ogataea haglerorum]KAG7694239.1 hypothetical protein KL951_004117 [Ogataea haglerorum]KAG7711960.1 hypothetical protein KL914_000602 [Ogataea haglerorum]KAG7712731.1 hypothetical protein KL950_000602 [Ogataea haglerorum]KAG7722782.1 hypothetical protein KL913_000602 [Ogataea haglerorum]
MDAQTLVNRYKKEGLFDLKRRELLDNFVASDDSKLNELLVKLIDLKVEKDPGILTQNKGRLVALIQTDLLKRQSSRPSGDKTHEEAIVDEINELLTGYVTKVVDDNKELNEELTSKLNEMRQGAESS